MKKKEIISIVLGFIAFLAIIGGVLYFLFLTPDSFQDNVFADIFIYGIKFLVLPVVTALMILFILNIPPHDFTKGDKSISVWVKIMMAIFILFFTQCSKIPLSIRTVPFLVFSMSPYLKLDKKEKSYAKMFLFYAVLFNPFIRVIFIIPPKIAYLFISGSLMIWGISDLIYYRINIRKVKKFR